MKELQLDTGSIDMIKCTDGKYYFLEVNPVGQYDMISMPCNFHLSEIIASELIEKK
jgi:glutathione synthase/RimK-type ligase-like ATP-grasp enzyme